MKNNTNSSSNKREAYFKQSVLKRANQYSCIMDLSIIEKALQSKTIVVVGLSKSEFKASYGVASYLQSAGYKIIPVNPTSAGQRILDEKVYSSVLEIPDKIDLVDVFRPSEEVLAVAEEVVKLKNKPRFFWMQLGIENEEAKQLLEKNGIQVVMNKCMMVEHKRLNP